MLISLLEKINNFNEFVFAPMDGLISQLPLEEWVLDAIIDSVHLLPLLFIVFVLIEIMEFYCSDKIDYYVKKAKKSSVVVGSFASILPQCGFSVITSSLYSKKLVSRGCLIAVYLGTSDETIPILLAHPSKAPLIVPIVGLKLFIAILVGYFVDFVSTRKVIDGDECGCIHLHDDEKVDIVEEGCCNHNPATSNKRELVLHPLTHTLNTFAFILVITFILNYALENISITQFIVNNISHYWNVIVMATIGLIPNCAISIAITMMLIKGTISFGAAMSGLLSNAGLGILVLLRHNDFRDNLKVISSLLLISIIAGLIIEFVV